jgi:hypothetical protein
VSACDQGAPSGAPAFGGATCTHVLSVRDHDLINVALEMFVRDAEHSAMQDRDRVSHYQSLGQHHRAELHARSAEFWAAEAEQSRELRERLAR